VTILDGQGSNVNGAGRASSYGGLGDQSLTYAGGDAFTFYGLIGPPPYPPSQVHWALVLEHGLSATADGRLADNHTHRIVDTSFSAFSFTPPRVDSLAVTASVDGEKSPYQALRVTLSVWSGVPTDANGQNSAGDLLSSSELRLWPRLGSLTFLTSPPGGVVVVDGQPRKTIDANGFVFRSVQGMQVEVDGSPGAPAAWSDGAPRGSRVVVVALAGAGVSYTLVLPPSASTSATPTSSQSGSRSKTRSHSPSRSRSRSRSRAPLVAPNSIASAAHRPALSSPPPGLIAIIVAVIAVVIAAALVE
jgi:hypothetical protein